MHFKLLVLTCVVFLLPGHIFADETSADQTSFAEFLEQSGYSQATTTLLQADGAAVTYAAECCKICRKGKACGNSCISREKTCRQPPGCACDG